MIIWMFLIIILGIRVLVRPFYFSVLNLIIILVYVIAFIVILGKLKWGLVWVLGTSLGSILIFFIFNEGVNYTLFLDFILLILVILGFFIEKEFN